MTTTIGKQRPWCPVRGTMWMPDTINLNDIEWDEPGARTRKRQKERQSRATLLQDHRGKLPAPLDESRNILF
jgi:hypothetical protein